MTPSSRRPGGRPPVPVNLASTVQLVAILALQAPCTLPVGQEAWLSEDSLTVPRRAGYLAGFAGTATVLPGQHFGIPIIGTMAHSFVRSHDDEATAFGKLARIRPTAAARPAGHQEMERQR